MHIELNISKIFDKSHVEIVIVITCIEYDKLNSPGPEDPIYPIYSLWLRVIYDKHINTSIFQSCLNSI